MWEIFFKLCSSILLFISGFYLHRQQLDEAQYFITATIVTMLLAKEAKNDPR
jgi:uncharacterized membrane protein YiaA